MLLLYSQYAYAIREGSMMIMTDTFVVKSSCDCRDRR